MVRAWYNLHNSAWIADNSVRRRQKLAESSIWLLFRNAKADSKKYMQEDSQETTWMVHGAKSYITLEQQGGKQFVSCVLVEQFQMDNRQMRKFNFLNENVTHSGQAATYMRSTMW